jgi:uncharacterized protein DUF1800
VIFNPPSVFGWPSDLAWVDTSSLLERYNFPLLLQTTKQDSASKFDPVQIVQNAESERDAVAQVSNQLFPEGLPSEMMDVIQQSSSRISDPALKLRNAVRLTMATPFYNLN